MSTWSDAPVRGTVLRGGAAALARPARMDSELRSTPFATSHVVDARLTDPHLADVVERARLCAVSEGHGEGYAAGYAAGAAAALAQAEQQAVAQALENAERERRGAERVAQTLAVLDVVAAAFERLERTAVEDVEAAVVDLALRLASAVLDRELALAADPGREAVVRALRLAPEGVPVLVHLHPDDAATVGSLEDLAVGRTLTVVADASVGRGGCVLEGAGRQVDAQVETALQRVAEALR